MLNNGDMMTDLLTVRELAAYLKLNSATVMRKAAKGEIPAIKIGRQFRFDKNQIDKWLTQKTVGKPTTILVVDDEPVIGQFFKDFLGREGHRVTSVTTGKEALELTSKERFDIIFLDLVMPGLAGHEVFKSIRQTDQEVPIAFITGYPDSDLMQKAMDQGPFMIIKKPVNASEIRQTINSLSGFVKGRK
jgi:excisionase family DNA binding protein